MKKLKLKLDGIKEMLTKEQMRKISGGYLSGNCTLSCYDINNTYLGGTALSNCEDTDLTDAVCEQYLVEQWWSRCWCH